MRIILIGICAVTTLLCVSDRALTDESDKGTSRDFRRQIPHIINMLSSKPSLPNVSERYAPRWKVNYYSKVMLCLPKGAMGRPTRTHYDGDCYASPNELWVARSLWSVNRSPENLERLYETYKTLAFGVLTPARYQSTGAAKTVDALLEAYEYVAATPASRSKLLEVHHELLEMMRDPTQLKHGHEWPWSDVIRAAYPHMKTTNGIPSNWPISFWSRRLSEGNIDVVARILTDIRRHYQTGIAPEASNAPKNRATRPVAVRSTKVPNSAVPKKLCTEPPTFIGCPNGASPFTDNGSSFPAGTTKRFGFGDQLFSHGDEGGSFAVTIYAEDMCGLWLQFAQSGSGNFTPIRPHAPTYRAFPAISDGTYEVVAGVRIAITSDSSGYFQAKLLEDIEEYEGE